MLQRERGELDRPAAGGSTRSRRAAPALPRYEAAIGNDGNVDAGPATATARTSPSVAAGRGGYQLDARHTGIAPERQPLRRQGARRRRRRQAQRRARRHRLGHLPRQGIQHPRAEPQPGGRLDRVAGRPTRCASPCAARSAAGITVVVAAGNFGQNAHGQRGLRHDRLARQRPVGDHRRRGQHQGHARRAATTASTSSARAARRAAATSTRGGVRRVDNLLKPDLVAPGNRIVGAAATQRVGASADLEPPRVSSYSELARRARSASRRSTARRR